VVREPPTGHLAFGLVHSAPSHDRGDLAEQPILGTRRKVAANIASNYVVLAAQVVFLLVMTPYIIDRLGTQTFGGWGIILSVAGYLRLLDLGLTPSVARFAARAKTPVALSAVVDSALTVLFAVGALALAAALGVALASPALFPDIPGLQPALLVAGVSAAVQIPLATFGGVLFGLQKIAERNVAILLRVVGSAVAIVIAVELGGHLLAFVSAIAIVELGVMAGQAVFCLRAVPGLKLRFPVVDRVLVREMGVFSFAILGLGVATQLAFYTDGIVIGIALTATAVAVYSVAMRVADGTSQLLPSASACSGRSPRHVMAGSLCTRSSTRSRTSSSASFSSDHSGSTASRWRR
jgi:O-antigen/teichoic acid export membrane protein